MASTFDLELLNKWKESEERSQLAKAIEEQIKKISKKESKGSFKPNSAATLARKAEKSRRSKRRKKSRKGAGGPLIDTGQMIQSVDFEVELK